MKNKTIVVAEIGINHGGDFNKAKQMIYEAKVAGADAVKFQIYTAEQRVGEGHKLFGLLKKCELSTGDFARLKAYADELKVAWFATPFDTDALSFMINQLGVRIVKVASMDVPNTKLLQEIASYSKTLNNFQVIMSTGMSDAKDINKAINALGGVKNLILLHCVSSYPTPEDKVNLEKIRTLSHISAGRYKVGYSDHSPTNDILAASLSVLLGAKVIERHFTLDINDGSVDNAVSSDPASFKNLVDIVRLHETMLGDGLLKVEDVEQPILPFRRQT